MNRVECPECGGSGIIVTCIDDLCQGAGECIHGDGEEICDECHGEGFVWVGGEGSLAARLESIEGKLTILANHALGLEEEPAPCKHRQVRIMPAKDPSYAIVLAGDVWPATIGKVITLHSNCIWAPANGYHVTVAWEAVLDACADPSSAARVTALWQAQSEAPI